MAFKWQPSLHLVAIFDYIHWQFSIAFAGNFALQYAVKSENIIGAVKVICGPRNVERSLDRDFKVTDEIYLNDKFKNKQFIDVVNDGQPMRISINYSKRQKEALKQIQTAAELEVCHTPSFDLGVAGKEFGITPKNVLISGGSLFSKKGSELPLNKSCDEVVIDTEKTDDFAGEKMNDTDNASTQSSKSRCIVS